MKSRGEYKFPRSGLKKSISSIMAANFSNSADRPYANGKEAKIWYLYVGDVQTRISNYKSTLINIFKTRGVHTVYDVACGVGIDSVMLLEEGFKVNSSDVDSGFLEQTRKSKEANPKFSDWQIGYGDWLELESAEVQHPAGGYDAILCIGNSFTTLPDFEGENRTHIRALQNFKNLLKVGGVLIIDHRNFDYVIEHKEFPPNSHGSIYYNSDRVFNVGAKDFVEKEGQVVKLTFCSDIDVSGTDLESDPLVVMKKKGEEGSVVPTLELNDIPCCIYSLEGFTGLLRKVFGDEAEHKVFPDFKETHGPGSGDVVPNYWVHSIYKS
ncbi:hypothetical protein ACHWQZ_G005493 [Mnemiopsis leidyi]